MSVFLNIIPNTIVKKKMVNKMQLDFLAFPDSLQSLQMTIHQVLNFKQFITPMKIAFLKLVEKRKSVSFQDVKKVKMRTEKQYIVTTFVTTASKFSMIMRMKNAQKLQLLANNFQYVPKHILENCFNTNKTHVKTYQISKIIKYYLPLFI